MTTIAILGLGQAGGMYARGLAAAGAEVHGFDPNRRLGDPAVTQHDDVASAVAGADVVVCLVPGSEAVDAATQAMSHVPAAALYADLNTTAPGTKSAVASLAQARGIAMADIAILAPVLRAGLRTPLLASGGGATRFSELIGPFGAPVEVIDGEPGDAARRKLLRSVYMKGLAALVMETMTAARAAGLEDWVRDQIAAELESADGHATIDAMDAGTHRHAVRREHEMRAALAMLEATGQPADLTRATVAWFERVVAGEA
ncbi:DUF1932 domain-containing protein [Microbacterium sp. BWT-B31]|uniref:DUF1932 domain-containing protein n=1 Tax=Microbacterium sp. BWT-B31 TaxID=3232072 RepID=UPI003527A780